MHRGSTGSGFAFSEVKAKLNGDRNYSPYFPLEQRSSSVSEPTRLHAVPMTSPASSAGVAFARGREVIRKVNGEFSALFTWFR